MLPCFFRNQNVFKKLHEYNAAQHRVRSYTLTNLSKLGSNLCLYTENRHVSLKVFKFQHVKKIKIKMLRPPWRSSGCNNPKLCSRSSITRLLCFWSWGTLPLPLSHTHHWYHLLCEKDSSPAKATCCWQTQWEAVVQSSAHLVLHTQSVVLCACAEWVTKCVQAFWAPIQKPQSWITWRQRKRNRRTGSKLRSFVLSSDHSRTGSK